MFCTVRSSIRLSISVNWYIILNKRTSRTNVPHFYIWENLLVFDLDKVQASWFLICCIINYSGFCVTCQVQLYFVFLATFCLCVLYAHFFPSSPTEYEVFLLVFRNIFGLLVFQSPFFERTVLWENVLVNIRKLRKSPINSSLIFT